MHRRSSRSVIGWLFLLLLLGAGCRSPRPDVAPPLDNGASVKPGINRDFLDPALQVDGWTERFEREGREVYDLRERIVAAAGLRRGDVVVDLGAGTGLFTLLLAREVGPSGRVDAVDIAPVFLAHIRRRAAEEGLTQVATVLGEERSIPLPARSADAVFLCDTYHHFEYPAEMLASIHRVLKPRGEILLVDFKRIPGVSSDWMLGHVRAGQEVFETEILAAGFRKVEEYDFLKDNYVVRFRKVGR